MPDQARDALGPFDHHRGAKPLLRRTHPLRTGLFLFINLVGFVVVNGFWRYLAVGEWTGFSPAVYRQQIARPLCDLLLHPLSIFSHPWMIVVWGLTLAVVVFVPLIVAVLYRLVFAGVFVLIIAVVAPSPALAAAVAVGCALAAYTPLRSDLPFLAVLLGMAPVAAFMLLLAFVGLEEATVLPVQRWLLTIPMLIALALVAVSSAVVLAMARVTGFRPGVVWPVLAALLVPPIAIFHVRVGADELAYAMIVNPPAQADRLVPGDAMLPAVPLSEWKSHYDVVGLSDRALRSHVEDELHRRRMALWQRCEGFLKAHPESDRAPEVLWIKAQAASLQLDESALDAEPGLVRFSASHPLPESEPYWQRLVTDYSGTPHAALARWRLGVLTLIRAVDADKPTVVADAADDQLRRAADGLGAMFPDGRPLQWTDPGEGLFAPPTSVPAHRYYAEATITVERLRWLIEQNDVLRNDRAARAMGEYASVNPLSRDQEERLMKLAGKYEDTPLGDNLKLAVARQIRDTYRQAEMLIWLAEGRPSDAAIEANYLLGMLALRTSEAPALPLIPELKDPREYFRLVLAGPPSPYHRLAEDRMRWLDASQRPGL